MNKLQQNHKIINVRVEKWRQMLKDQQFTDLALVYKRVKKGIPIMIRQKAWSRLINLNRFKAQSNECYELLIKESSRTEQSIRLDILRTYTQEKTDIMRQSLFNVLKAISLVYPQLGYCQGMNNLIMKLLQALNDQTAFWIINYLVRTYRNILWKYKNPSTLQLQNNTLSKLMSKFIPKILFKIQKQQIQLSSFTSKWFITLFSSILPTQLFYRIFQCMLIEGYSVIYKAALSLLKLNQSFILQGSFEQVVSFLNSNTRFQNINIEQFCNIMHSFKLSQQNVNEIQLKFIDDNFELIIQWQQQAQQYYQKRLMNCVLTKKQSSLSASTSSSFSNNI